MSVIDGIAAQIDEFANFLGISPEQLEENLSDVDDPTEALATVIDLIEPFGEGGDILVDTTEEFILTPLRNEDQLTPANVEDALDALEGNAAAVAAGVIAVTTVIESGTLGQVDEVPDEIYQTLAGLGFQEATGREIDARLQEGVDPALKQLAHQDARSKQADFQDYVEANLALRKSNSEIPTREGIEEGELPDYLNPADIGWLPDPDTYGTVPEQDSLFELASLNVSEPEELIEEPIQYGIPVPKLAIEQAVELRGTPRDAATVYEQVIDELPKTENLLRDYVRLTEFLFRLREKVESGAITPKQARELVEPELRDLIVDAIPPERLREEDRTADEVVDILIEEIERNFELLTALPPDPPTQAQLEAWYRKGVIESQKFADLYELFGEAPQDLDKYLTEEAIDQGWEDIQRQVALGRISTTEGQFRLKLIGYSSQEAGQILQGADGDAIVANRIEQRAGNLNLPLQIAEEIGPVRANQLRAFGINTLTGMVDAGVDRLVGITDLTDREAGRAIESAERFIEAQD